MVATKLQTTTAIKIEAPSTQKSYFYSPAKYSTTIETAADIIRIINISSEIASLKISHRVAFFLFLY
jgi:hypothetical protein